MESKETLKLILEKTCELPKNGEKTKFIMDFESVYVEIITESN